MKKERLKNKLKKQKGITLIALVVTIIVLIILAVISVNLVFNENGIIGKAQKAGEFQANAEASDNERLGQLDREIDIALGIDNSELGKLKTEGKYVETNTTVKDKNGDTVIIPKGFKIASDSGSSVIEGIVIEDDDIIGEGTGNQYVWVPVTKDANGDATEPYKDSGKLSDGTEIQLSRYVFDDNGMEIAKGRIINSFDDIQMQQNNTIYWLTYERDEIGESYNSEIETYKASVAENGGYYIARYEASYGIDNKANSKKSTSYSGELIEGRLWNNITQTDALDVCKNMYLETKSDLINSYAWDTAIVYIQKCSKVSNYSKNTSKNTSISNTGNNNDEMCKINDMSSNLGEWTTEISDWNCIHGGSAVKHGCVCRGGRYSQPNYFTSFRGEKYTNSSDYFSVLPTDSAEDKGFRAILYL